jgi:uncharacterized membrane protein (DUF2068 family)
VCAVGAVAAAYSFLRFVEAYGLWYARTWAEWIALISGTLYLPIEIYNVIRTPSLFLIGFLIVHVTVVLYMVYALRTGEGIHGVRQPT